MHEKLGFFNLDKKIQNRLEYYMIGLVVTNLLTALIPPFQRGPVSLVLALAINISIAYFIIKIDRAPNFFFSMFFAAYIITLIFNGLETFTILSGNEPALIKNIPQAAAFVYTLIITPDMWKFFQSIQASKAQVKA